MLFNWSINKILPLTLFLTIAGYSCEKETNSEDSYTITIAAFELVNGIYTNTGNTITFNSVGDCQTWSRTSNDTIHGNNGSHLHFNAAKNVNYNAADSIISYTEFGPELSQEDIDAVCSNNSQNGVDKVVTASSYYQDKPTLYLKIINVE